MTPTVQIHLDDSRCDYAAGDTLAGTVEPVLVGGDVEVKDTELSVLWYTEGKGDQDMGVVHLERLWDGMLQPMGGHRFSVRLPLLPLTYHGHLLKIHWVVRVRMDLRRGQDVVVDEPFNLFSEERLPRQGPDSDHDDQLSRWRGRPDGD